MSNVVRFCAIHYTFLFTWNHFSETCSKNLGFQSVISHMWTHWLKSSCHLIAINRFVQFVLRVNKSGWFQVRENRHVGKSGESNFEDGTIPFLSILSLGFGFEVINRIGMSRISEHTFHLAKYFYQSLKNLKYPNGNPVVQVYNSGYSCFTFVK